MCKKMLSRLPLLSLLSPFARVLLFARFQHQPLLRCSLIWGEPQTKLRHHIGGVAPTTAIFIFGGPNVAITGGNEQEGVLGGRLDDPLVVRVRDGKGRPISGLAVRFFYRDGNGWYVYSCPGYNVYTTDAVGNVLASAYSAFTRVATSTRPAPGTDIVVQTNSRGEARTYFQLGTDASQTVNVEAGGVSPIVPALFRFTAESGTRRPTLKYILREQPTDRRPRGH